MDLIDFLTFFQLIIYAPLDLDREKKKELGSGNEACAVASAGPSLILSTYPFSFGSRLSQVFFLHHRVSFSLSLVDMAPRFSLSFPLLRHLRAARDPRIQYARDAALG